MQINIFTTKPLREILYFYFTPFTVKYFWDGQQIAVALITNFYKKHDYNYNTLQL